MFFKHRYSQYFISKNVNLIGLSIGENYETIESIPLLIDISCRKKFSSAQPLKVIFKFSERVPTFVETNANKITNEEISAVSGGKKPF